MVLAVQIDEADVLRRAREGDEAAFEALVRRFQERVRLFFALRQRDPSRIDDLAQETFLAAFRKLATYDASRPFYPWLKGIALNVLSNERRRRQPDTLDDAVDELVAAEADQHEESDLGRALKTCLEKLQESAARLVDGRYREGLSIDTLAQREGKSAKAVSVALVRIRVALQHCVEREAPHE